MGTSYGVTTALYNYWKRAGYSPVYLRLTANELTGEHTCIMLTTLSTHDCDEGWLPALHADFKRRFIPLLGYDFRNFPIALGLDILAPRITGQDTKESTDVVTAGELQQHFSPYDLRRLESYASQLVDYHMVLDLIPIMAKFYFLQRTNVAVSFSQAAILLALGLQHRGITELDGPLSELKPNQVLALFNKVVRKMSEAFKAVQESQIEAEMKKKDRKRDLSRIGSLADAEGLGDMDAELEQGGRAMTEAIRAKQQALMADTDLQQYAITGDDEAWDSALSQTAGPGGLTHLSVANKSGKKKHNHPKKRSQEGGTPGKSGGTPGSGKKKKAKH